MKCPHCQIQIHPGFEDEWLNRSNLLGATEKRRTTYSVRHMVCPSCSEAIIFLHQHRQGLDNPKVMMIYPKAMQRSKAPSVVPEELATDFNEACVVLGESPKASAALSRRCLQHLLRLQGYTQHDLVKAIDAVLASKTLPSPLADSLDAVRNIGNFAAHPMKDTNSGEILEVEPEEAEWNLEVLEGLFDFYYVQPAKAQGRIDALNNKLAAAGKPPLKK